jgi:hypothetical protein
MKRAFSACPAVLRRTCLLLLGVSLAALSGCLNFQNRVRTNFRRAEKKVNAFVDAELRTGINRVLVMPVVNASRQKGVESRVEEALLLQLTRGGYFERVRYTQVPEEATARLQKAFRNFTGRYDETLVQEIGARYNFDAVLFAEVTHYRPYKPLVFGYKHFMIETGEGRIVWSVDDVFDMAEKNTLALAKNWYYKTHEPGVNPGLEEDVMEVSMHHFINFAFSLICETWTRS